MVVKFDDRDRCYCHHHHHRHVHRGNDDSNVDAVIGSGGNHQTCGNDEQ